MGIEIEIKIQDAVAAVYRKYGANLAAFWRDAFAAEAQKHGDPVELHALDGNCIHYVPICHRCRIVTVEVHLKDKEAIRAEEREAAFKEAIAIIVGQPIAHYIYSGAYPMTADTFRDNAVKAIEATIAIERARAENRKGEG